MTLIAGFRCIDGFIVAADTEIREGSTSYQGHKLLFYNGASWDWVLRIGYSGFVDYALMASQWIRDAVTGLENPTFDQIRAITGDVVGHIYDDVIPWKGRPKKDETPGFNLMIGIQDAKGRIGILQTDEKVVLEVEERAFVGVGSEMAGHVAEKLFGSRLLSTAVTEHLVQQLFREIKGAVSGVGGNTEILSRRANLPKTKPFFDITRPKVQRDPTESKDVARDRAERLHGRFLWGLDSVLRSAVRVALNGQYEGTFKLRQDFIRDGLTKLRDDAANKDLQVDKIERHTNEYGTPYLNPAEDLFAPGAIPGEN
jgi:hypothetical protein